MKIPAAIHIQFIHIIHLEYRKLREEHFKEYGKYAQVVSIEKKEIEHFKTDGFRLLGTIPALVHKMSETQIKEYSGYPRFNFGQYYEPKDLFLLDDIIKYNHHEIEFKDIRTAESFIPKNENKL